MTEVNYYAVKRVNNGIATTIGIYETKEQAEEASQLLNKRCAKYKYSVITSSACLSDDMLTKHKQALLGSKRDLDSLRGELKGLRG